MSVRVADGAALLARGAWADARDAFQNALAEADSPEAWDGLSWAGWWLGDAAITLDARERAYRGYRAAGDAYAAARLAAWLGADLLDFRGDDALAEAWLRRAHSLVDGREPCAEQGWITLLEADIALLAHADPVVAVERAQAGLELARALSDAGLEVVGQAILGSALVAAGRVTDGLAQIDEAGSLAVCEDFAEDFACGWALCHTVTVCAEVGDFGRASQWARAMRERAAAWSARHFFGICRTAYGAVLTTRGDWPTAERELTSALADLQETRQGLAGASAVRLGELRARQGRVDEARALFEEALPSSAAVVALGELDLAAGDPQAATDAAERVLRRLSAAAPLERFPALELLARARAAAGDAPVAREAMAEVAYEGARLGTPYMRGRGALVAAIVQQSLGEHEDARCAAEDAVDLFAECAAPYETARARLALAEALEALGRVAPAAMEARSARETLAQLGVATRDPKAATEALTARELDVLRLVAQGLSDPEIAERLVVSPHTVHRHVANIRTKLRLSSRAAAVAFAAREGLL